MFVGEGMSLVRGDSEETFLDLGICRFERVSCLHNGKLVVEYVMIEFGSNLGAEYVARSITLSSWTFS